MGYLREKIDEYSLQKLAQILSDQVAPGSIVYLQGPLGAGKTTFARSFIKQRGYTGLVKSPTYGIVELYEELAVPIYHFDLYRIQDEEELELIGIRDYFNEQAICLIEWPEQAGSLLPSPDFVIRLQPELNLRTIEITAFTTQALEVLALLK